MLSAKIRSCALVFLGRREHSKSELQCKLSKKGFPAGDIIELTQELADRGLQSDARFIESYINMRRNRGFGPMRIQAELCERGIDKKQAEKFLRIKDFTWLEQAKIVRYKKFGEKIPLDLRKRTVQMRRLYYKGFTTDHIKTIFNHEDFGN